MRLSIYTAAAGRWAVSMSYPLLNCFYRDIALLGIIFTSLWSLFTFSLASNLFHFFLHPWPQIKCYQQRIFSVKFSTFFQSTQSFFYMLLFIYIAESLAGTFKALMYHITNPLNSVLCNILKDLFGYHTHTHPAYDIIWYIYHYFYFPNKYLKNKAIILVQDYLRKMLKLLSLIKFVMHKLI